MSDPGDDQVHEPFTAFNFAVEINVPGKSGLACNAAFAECDGLEASLEVKTIRQGGDNGRQIRLAGPVALGQVTLKRGMTASFDLWDWFRAVVERPELRADAQVIVYANDGTTPRARFVLTRCVPIKVKAPALNAKEGGVAIEELQLAYEALELRRPEGRGA
jgi:phage tail-like protein